MAGSIVEGSVPIKPIKVIAVYLCLFLFIPTFSLANINKKTNKIKDFYGEFICELNCNVPHQRRHKYASIIIKLSNQYNVPHEVIFSVIWQETHFRNITGDNGNAFGLMQVHENTAELVLEKDIENPYDALILNYEQGIRAGVLYLKRKMDHFNGNIHMALRGYNGGSRIFMNSVKIYASEVQQKKYVVHQLMEKEGL